VEAKLVQGDARISKALATLPQRVAIPNLPTKDPKKEAEDNEKRERTITFGRFPMDTKSENIKAFIESITASVKDDIEETFAFGKKRAERGAARFKSSAGMWKYMTENAGSHKHKYEGNDIYVNVEGKSDKNEQDLAQEAAEKAQAKLKLSFSPPGLYLPEVFQEEAILRYDLVRYPFREVVHAVLEEPLDCDLGRLHATQQGITLMRNFEKRPENLDTLGPRRNPWNRAFHSSPSQHPEVFGRFRALYHDFLGTFVLEHLQTRRLAFQALPTFRCHLPGCGAPGRPHRDSDYHHAACEVNFWYRSLLLLAATAYTLSRGAEPRTSGRLSWPWVNSCVSTAIRSGITR